jgi:hypothetical protein
MDQKLNGIFSRLSKEAEKEIPNYKKPSPFKAKQKIILPSVPLSLSERAARLIVPKDDKFS